MFWACSAEISFSNSMLIASEWPTNTGTRTQVAVTFTLGSRIFLVSATIFHSSLVEPSSRQTSICGIKIGSATCRERGCQDGKLSVVAVSLNKKLSSQLPYPQTNTQT